MKDGSIKINNAQEVMSHISCEADLLNRYAELIRQEAKASVELENLVAEISQSLNRKKQDLYIAIEQTQRLEESDVKRQAMCNLQSEMDKCESYVHNINQCNDDVNSIRQDYLSLVQNATVIANNSKVLSTKIEKVIKEIIDATGGGNI